MDLSTRDNSIHFIKEKKRLSFKLLIGEWLIIVHFCVFYCENWWEKWTENGQERTFVLSILTEKKTALKKNMQRIPAKRVLFCYFFCVFFVLRPQTGGVRFCIYIYLYICISDRKSDYYFRACIFFGGFASGSKWSSTRRQRHGSCGLRPQLRSKKNDTTKIA